jgi:membrane protein DedA with SNARE-associated domain
MMFSIKTIPKIWKDSAVMGSAIFAVIATFMGVAGISLDSIISNQKWWNRLLVILAVYAFLVVILRVILSLTVRKGITIKIRGI